jgi:PAS domain S-box-containing protein
MRTEIPTRRADEAVPVRAPVTRSPAPPRRRRVRLRGGLGWVVGMYLILIAGILAYNAKVTDQERSSALVVNIAGRQHAFAERYVKDVLLKATGSQAAPEEDAAILQRTAAALLHGGEVLAVQGADASIAIQPADRDGRVVAKLQHEQALIRELVDRGDEVLATDPATRDFSQRVLRLRITGAQMSAISNDAVGQMTLDLDSSLRRLRLVGLALGLLGTLAAIAMAVLLRRKAAVQAKRFGALVHQSSDLVTVIEPEGTVRYQSASAEQILSVPASKLVGSDLCSLIHPEDVPRALALWAELARRPHATSRIEYRLRSGNGSWMHVESAVTNLLLDPTVGGLVLNTRDITERHDIEEALTRLQAERGQLLDRTVQATEQERKRIAAELHDGPVQRLTALDLKLSWIGGEIERGQIDVVEHLQDADSLLREQIRQLRMMMTQLRPPILDERGLEAALRDHLISKEERVQLQVSVEASLLKRLAPAQEIVLYRVAQEAVANVLKHAQADHAWLTLQERGGQLLLEVRDDGAGFDPLHVLDGSNGHFGILGMRERVEMAGGSWELDSVAGEGTTIRATLPREEGSHG